MFKGLIFIILLFPIASFSAIDAKIVDKLRQNHQFQNLLTKDNIKINYSATFHPNEKGAILFLQGVNESCDKWSDLLQELHESAYTIYCYDHRGQGRSTHLGSEQDVYHVDKFEHYTEDLDLFVESIIKSRKHKNLFLLSHSMGGAVATRYLQRFEDKNPFKAVVMSSPMHSMEIMSIPETVTWLVAKTFSFLGLNRGVPFAPKFDPNIDLDDLFENVDMTHDKKRFKRAYSFIQTSINHSTTRPSPGWALECLNMVPKIREEAHKLKTPILIMQAGKDILIARHGQDAVCKKASNCRLKRFDDSFHEILNEVDPIRNEALLSIRNFFKEFTI